METIKKIDDERVEVTKEEVIIYEKKNLLREIVECEETIERNKRWLKQLE